MSLVNILKEQELLHDGWEEFDDYMIYNEELKRVITWTTYGDDKQMYFLSTEYYYDDDMFEEVSGTRNTLVNEDLDGNLTELIGRTKDMR